MDVSFVSFFINKPLLIYLFLFLNFRKKYPILYVKLADLLFLSTLEKAIYIYLEENIDF